MTSFSSPETYEWITSTIRRAQENGFTVFGMMQHGAAEHFAGQKTLFADLGMAVVFTGHFHAQEIVKVETDPDGLAQCARPMGPGSGTARGPSLTYFS